jgi:hypothetical protein
VLVARGQGTIGSSNGAISGGALAIPVQVALAVRSCIGDELDAIPVLIIDVEKYSGWLSSIGDSAR